MNGLHPSRALAALRGAAADLPARVTEQVAQLVRNTPTDRLEQLMGSPARRVVLEVIFRQMPRRLDRGRARGTEATIRWEITGGPGGGKDTYQVEIKDGDCRVRRDPDGSDPQVTLTLDGAEFLRIATGATDPTRAYFSGRVTVSGDVMAAAKLGTLFVRPGAGG